MGKFSLLVLILGYVNSIKMEYSQLKNTYVFFFWSSQVVELWPAKTSIWIKFYKKKVPTVSIFKRSEIGHSFTYRKDDFFI